MPRRTLTLGAALLLAAATACSGGASGDEPDVLMPGGPGESASPASQEQIDAANQEITHNEADVVYLLKMIEHHKQALDMTAMAPERVENEDVEKIADRIEDAQGPEIEAMEAWLETNVYGPAEGNPNYADSCGLTQWREGDDGVEGGGHHGGGGLEACPIEIDHTDMPGMLTQDQLDDLEASDGAEFDALFVELMTEHHEGAIEMAEDVTVDGKDTDVLRMANDVIAEQQADIARMEEALEG
ncbi:DUF305 domain-containing protein [Nocardiopsis halophila]|uniref:DUF305 domain-containing protein n=1 Tax=Nocardiopsis halophila TaxID=141692 RepID=UPI00034C03D5|nr:DUF305 domain-containing protein [Nocardiopsis halophila]